MTNERSAPDGFRESEPKPPPTEWSDPDQRAPLPVHLRDCGDHDTPIAEHGNWCDCPCHGRHGLVVYEPPAVGETGPDRRRRQDRNREARAQREAWLAAKCATCGYARINVRHETDRENAPEGPDYYADVPFCEFAEIDR